MPKDWLREYRKFNGKSFRLRDTSYTKSELKKPKYATHFRIVKKGRVYCLYAR